MKEQDTFIQDLKDTIQSVAHKSFYPNHFSQAIFYSLFNYGKFFRSRLLFNLCQDQEINVDERILKLAAFLEIHHCYTLIHDDLPCMDDDELRRGQPTSHIKFNEATAVLAGDALLHCSMHLISQIDFNQAINNFIINATSWATGGKGLLLGQYLDLNLTQKTVSDIWRIHELKTARLIQLPFLWTSALSGKIDLKSVKVNLRLGSILGILFQVLDDLEELDELEVSGDLHELEINLFQTSHVEYTITNLEKLLTNFNAHFPKQTCQQTYQQLKMYVDSRIKLVNQQKIKNNKIVEAINLLQTF